MSSGIGSNGARQMRTRLQVTIWSRLSAVVRFGSCPVSVSPDQYLNATGGRPLQASVSGSAKCREGGTRRPRPVLLMAAWLLGAGLTAVMGLIHLRLWLDGYREIPIIGTLFISNAICSGVLAIVLMTAPGRLRGPAAFITALFTAGTLAGLIASLTIGLFGIHEVLQAPLVVTTLIVEPVGVLVLLLTAAFHARRQRHQ
ncbi:MAG: hypothetical protein M3319_15145 [Actinomycetota bacterium]|nr:hypothetical protein [Actinomycetota bacterium]